MRTFDHSTHDIKQFEPKSESYTAMGRLSELRKCILLKQGEIVSTEDVIALLDSRRELIDKIITELQRLQRLGYNGLNLSYAGNLPVSCREYSAEELAAIQRRITSTKRSEKLRLAAEYLEKHNKLILEVAEGIE